jgi:hypothetical protein
MILEGKLIISYSTLMGRRRDKTVGIATAYWLDE